ncbi:fluconazole resistance protein 3 [Podospora australis]|uniref:Fluconazole resistance protein 3 n=1 Tax=Podospora australis TaxID=1536484 RepID=A0AAN6WVZ4_9PEZI|nr:fluconazole resistance protein 3 [Podospora australis]
MDYTHSHTAFYAASQPYQFMGIPPLAAPLTPDITTPPEVYEQFPSGLPNEQFPPNRIPHDQFRSYDSFVQFSSGQTFPGPPTPPGQLPPPAGHVAGAPVPVQAVPPTTTGAAIAQAAQTLSNPTDHLIPVSIFDPESARGQRQGSHSDEEELTPAQSRRKAQNRAAQRAFRERKERHVKDLETRLQKVQQKEQETALENERLKKDLQKISTENEILRATSAANPVSPAGNSSPTTTGPMLYNPTDFYSNVLQGHQNQTPSHRIVTSDDGERLLAAGATWEMIISHELFRRGLVDVGQVSARLRPQAKCDGQGPVFEERAIREAIENSVASGTDELL